MLGNKLVQEYHFEPAIGRFLNNRNTHPIKVFIDWINHNPEIQQVLKELGYDWPV